MRLYIGLYLPSLTEIITSCFAFDPSPVSFKSIKTQPGNFCTMVSHVDQPFKSRLTMLHIGNFKLILQRNWRIAKNLGKIDVSFTPKPLKGHHLFVLFNTKFTQGFLWQLSPIIFGQWLSALARDLNFLVIVTTSRAQWVDPTLVRLAIKHAWI